MSHGTIVDIERQESVRDATLAEIREWTRSELADPGSTRIAIGGRRCKIIDVDFGALPGAADLLRSIPAGSILGQGLAVEVDLDRVSDADATAVVYRYRDWCFAFARFLTRAGDARCA